MIKICKDGRIWGQTNKQASSHFGILIKNKEIKDITKWNKGENNPNWKGGISKQKGYVASWARKNREKNPHQENYKISNKKWREKNPYTIKFHNHKRRLLDKGLKTKTIQLVYEDNIKKYGTLTCYLCELPIEFGKDSLEHKTPLSRGGTNLYENLEVACQKCNHKKHSKTEEEYRKLVNGGN